MVISLSEIYEAPVFLQVLWKPIFLLFFSNVRIEFLDLT